MNHYVKVLKQTVNEFLYKPNPISNAGLRIYRAFHLLREHLIPSRRRARYEDYQFDARFGVKTKARLYSAPGVSKNQQFSAGYGPVRPPNFRAALNHFKIGYENFTFIDFGSGMGRALLLASDYPFKRIIGVEFSPALHSIAEENIRRYRSESQRCSEIESICIDATQFQIPQENAVFFFFNPFRAEIMERVLTNIQRSLEAFPREALFIYLLPTALEVFDRFDFDKDHVFASSKA
jgi:hypothetical protein